MPRRASPQPGSRVLGAGNSGIFGNLAARPDGRPRGNGEEDGVDYVPETEQKDGPPVSCTFRVVGHMDSIDGRGCCVCSKV